MVASIFKRLGIAVAFFVVAQASAQTTTFNWQNAANGTWFTPSNWNAGTAPNNITTNRATVAAAGSSYTVTASGGTSLGVLGLDVSSSSAQVVFDFSSSSLGLSLGSATSNWSAGTIEFKNAAGLGGNGSTNTTLTIGSGSQLLFSTLTNTRGLNSLTLNNSGTVQVNTGIVSASSAVINNLAGGLIHANGAEFVFQNGTTLANSGTLRATGSAGILRFNGTVTTGNLGLVDLVSGAHAYLGGTFDNSSATLAAPSGGSFELVGGKITGGTIASGAVTFTSSGGYFDAATLTGNLTLSANTYVRFTSGATFSGGNATFGSNSGVYWQQNGTLSAKSLTFGANSYLYVSGGNNTLTLDAATTGTGHIQIYSDGSNGTAITTAAALTHTVNTGYLYARSFTNSGNITATGGALVIGSTSSGYSTSNSGNITVDGSSATLYLDGGVANTGTITAQNSGQLYFRGTTTTANLGNVAVTTSGHAYLNGTLDNTLATLNAPITGKFELLGGTITGGTVASGALNFTTSGGYLDNTTLAGDFVLPANDYVRMTNKTSFTGANLTLGNNSSLYWQQSGTLAGKTLAFGTNSYVYVNGGNNTLTLDSATSGTGQIQIYSDGSNGTAITNAGTLTHTVNTGYLYARDFTNSGNITATGGSLVIGSTSTNYNSTNTGTITADGNATIVYLDGNVTNSGGLTAQNAGQFRFRGTNTTANLGNITLTSGGHAYLNGTLDNSGNTLSAPNGGSFELLGGKIVGGTINAGAVALTSSGGTVDGVTLIGDLNIAQSTGVYVTGGSTFTGGNATFDNNSWLYWQQGGKLSGKALTFGANSYLYINGGNNSLTLDSATTATGQVQIYTDGSNGTSLTNAGNITHTLNTGYLYGRSFNNSGNIKAAAGSLVIGSTSSGYSTANSGNITADGNGTIVYLDGDVANTGVLTAQNSGQLRFRGNNNTAALGNITLATSGHAYLNGTLDNNGSTLLAPLGGVFELLGGTINNGTIGSGALQLTSSGGTLNHVTWTGDYTSGNSTGVYFTGGTNFTGGNATLGSNSWLYWQQGSTLAGKALSFGANAYIYVNGGNNSLTLDATSSATGHVQIYSDGSNGTAITNQGNITHTLNTGYLYARNFTNSGAITASGGDLVIGSTSTSYLTLNSGSVTADGNGTIVYLDGNVTNTGTLTAKNAGELRFRGTNTTGNLGNVTVSTGGHAYLNGTLTNTSANLNAPNGGAYELLGGTITGGTVANGALTFTSWGGTLNGVSLTGDFSSSNSTGVYFTGGTNFTGGNATFGNNAWLYWQQAGTLASKALTFGNNAYVYLSGTNSALTLDAGTSAAGQIQIYSDGSNGTSLTTQGNVTHTGNTGYLQARTLSNSGNIVATAGTLYIGVDSTSYATTNTGTIKADGSNANVIISGTVVNQGTLIAQNAGQLTMNGNTTTANIGSVQINTGGHVYLNGTLDNSSATLNAPTGGSFELYGGTINNGTVAANALTFTNYAGRLNNVSLLGDIVFPAGAYSYFSAGTHFANGAAVTLGNNASIYWQQAGTLANNTLTFGSGAYLYINGGNAAVTLDNTSMASGDVHISADSSAGTAFTNQGTITHSSGTGYLDAETVANAGSITATNGTLYIGRTTAGSAITNANGATLRVNGGAIVVQPPSANPLLNNGTIDVQSGTFYTNNRVTNGATGLVQGAGVINGSMTLAGGTLAPGNGGIGLLTFSGGALTVTGAATFAVDLGGATSDKLVFQNPTSVVNLGTGLLALSLNLLSAPTANTTFNLITISSGGSGISGSFAGLANTGDTITANFGGTPFTFAVKYQTNLVSLSYTPIVVPEPSVYALLGVGLATVGYLRRRRRP